MKIKALNPMNGLVIQEYDELSRQDLDEIIALSHQSQQRWRRTDFSLRAELMKKAAAVLRERKEQYAHLMALEMGKTLREGRAETEKCAWVCNYYAENAETFLHDEMINSDARKSYVCFQPLGVILAVMPWNFPFWQVFRFAAPALMAGNAGILKHASNVPGCALAIEDVFRSAGFPEHLFRTLMIGSGLVTTVIDHPLVKAATLTGSTPAGQAVAAKAGAVLKKTVLELGGSDPYVILGDADLDLAVEACVTSRLINAGQSCIAAKRFIVVKSVLSAFETRFVELMKTKKYGDPLDDSSDIGPMARTDLRDELHAQVIQSIAMGARCLLGGTVPPERGAFYPPTVLCDVTKGMPAYDQELFGPVAAIITANDENEAIHKANDTIFGLGAAVFSRDLKRAERIAALELEAGCCFVNAFVKSDPRLPFGGIKESGYGRELSDYGIREFVNIKTVYVK